MKVSVIFFSRTGTTKKIALQIAGPLGALVEEISEDKKRTGLIGYLKSGREAFQKKIISVNDAKHNLSASDLVVIGTPIWSWNISSPVRSFLTKYKDSIKGKVAFFCTQGGSGAKTAFKEMGSILRKAPVAVLALTTKKVVNDSSSDKVREFVEKLKSS